MQQSFEIREIQPKELPAALALVWDVFSRFEAPAYSPQGVEEFRRYIDAESIGQLLSENKLLMWIYLENNAILGLLAARPDRHISLLFVHAAHHRRGIARALFQTMCLAFQADGTSGDLTVNSSPYAFEAYRRLGFIPTAPEQTANGIRFVPMQRPL